MSRRAVDLFQTIRTEGGLLPPELLKRIADGDRELPGLSPSDYHLEEGARLSEAVTRAWNRLRGAWESLREARANLPADAPDAALTRDRWLLVLFQELGYGRLPAARGAVEIDGKPYPISHVWHHTPIHLVGFRTDLDRRTAGVAGAAKQSPHSLVQGVLNRSADRLWGFVSNGLQLRLLRDSASLTRQAYVEFDLEAMMDGEVYSDFALLWLVCHQSRVEAERPDQCWLERWAQAARDQGTRALDRLRGGVEATIAALGRGFLAHPKNGALRDALRTGALDKQDYYRELLRFVYRLLFLLVAEDRGLLLDPNAKLDAKSRYLEHYSTARLRRLAARRRGGPHPDGWRALRLVMAKLGDDAGCPDLALPPLGSFLWSRAAVPHLACAELANEHLFEAVRALAFTEQDRLLRPVDWRNLDSEELGSVYESLLELHPEVDAGAARFELSSAAGNERKTTGSYYTPDSLVQCLLDTALDPILDEACKKPNPEQAILDLKVCDPASGSGHFLIAAARRLARRLAQVRTGDAEPDPTAMQTALRDVIGKCMYGVDVNPMAVELCKVSLWLEAIEPGKPLSFLDHQIQCGNSLLGTTPALLAKGIPDEAFEPIEGDDRAVARRFKRRNCDERTGQTTMFGDFARDAIPPYGSAAARAVDLANLPDDSIAAVHRKEEAFRRLAESKEFRSSKLLADAWCAAFVWRKTEDAPEPPTAEIFRRLSKDPSSVPAATREESERLARAYGFLHWHLAFPEVFRDPGEHKPESEKMVWDGGFSAVLGNPPWEMLQVQEAEFFAVRATDAKTPKTRAARKREIDRLRSENPDLGNRFAALSRQVAGQRAFLVESGRFPLASVGRVNLYKGFLELGWDLLAPISRLGMIVPSGIATDDFSAPFFSAMVTRGSLRSLFDFENRDQLFPDVHSSMRFSLITLSGKTHRPGSSAKFAFFLHQVSEISDPERVFGLSVDDIRLLNPTTASCPIFRCQRDLALCRSIYERHPVLVLERDDQPEKLWDVQFGRIFNLGHEGDRFTPVESLPPSEGKDTSAAWLPLFEGKMFASYDHRAGSVTYNPANQTRPFQSEDSTLAEHQDPNFRVRSQFYLQRDVLIERLAGQWSRQWLVGAKDVTAATNERTVIATVLPLVPTSYSVRVLVGRALEASSAACFLAMLNSFPYDWIVRQFLGGLHLQDSITKQSAVIHPQRFQAPTPWDGESLLQSWIALRVLELTYTAWDLEPWAKDLGYDGPPFRWDEPRHFLLRCELDAAFFHLYLGSPEDWKGNSPSELLAAFPTPRDAVDYIMDTFPIVRRKDEKARGDYRTKRTILEIYGAMLTATNTGRGYETRLAPPPADPRVAHPARSAS